MKITAPELPFEKEMINFYFEYLINWLLLFAKEKESNNLRFEYIINRFAKLNLLSLLINSKFKNRISDIIENFMKIVENGFYEINKMVFINIKNTISNLISEYSEFPKEVLRVLVLNLNKKKNKFRYEISYYVIEKNKNMLFTPISNFLMDKINDEFLGDNYYRIIKSLNLIGKEFLMNFFMEIKINKNGKIIGKTHGVPIFKIILKVFSQNNSIYLGIKYKNIIENLMNNLNSKNKNEQKEIFKCLCKFIARNEKEELKKVFLYSLIKEKINIYLCDIQDGKLMDFCLNLCLKLNDRKIFKIICSSFLNSRINITNEKTIQFVFDFISEKIIKNFNLCDFQSNEKVKFLKSISSVFILIIKKLKIYENLFENGINQLFDLNKENKFSLSLILTIILFLSMKNENDFYDLNLYFFKNYRIKEEKENSIKKQYINFKYLDNIQLMLDFISQYIIFVDEKLNPNSIKILNSMIYVIIYFIRFLLYDLEILIIEKYKDILFQIFDIIKIIISNEIDNTSIINSIISLIKDLIYFDDNDIQNKIKEILSRDLFNLIINKGKKNIKSLSFIIDKFNELNIENKNFEILVPKDLLTLIKNNFTSSNPIILINDLLSIDEKKKYDLIFFTDDFINYIINDFKNEINEKISLKKDIIKKNNINEDFNEIIDYVNLYHETLIFQSFCLIKLNDKKEINLFIKFILNEIYEIYIQNEEKKKKEEEINYYKQFQYLCIEKYISLLFRLIENGVKFKPSHHIKIINLLLSKNKAIRNYFIEKIYSRIIKKKPLDYFFNIIPMVTISFSDPYKLLSQKAKKIFSGFIKEISKRIKNRNLNDISSYKYIPEVYISNIISYCVFNNNLNAFFKFSNKKDFFKNIFNEFLKIIKQNCSNIDSNFILRNLDVLKKTDLSKKKIIKKIFSNNLIFEVNYQLEDINYEDIKNKIIDFLITLINSNYISNFSYGNINPRIPLIFLNNEIYESKNKTIEKNDNTFILDIDILKSNNQSKNNDNSKKLNSKSLKEL